MYSFAMHWKVFGHVKGFVCPAIESLLNFYRRVDIISLSPIIKNLYISISILYSLYFRINALTQTSTEANYAKLHKAKPDGHF